MSVVVSDELTLLENQLFEDGLVGVARGSGTPFNLKLKPRSVLEHAYPLYMYNTYMYGMYTIMCIAHKLKDNDDKHPVIIINYTCICKGMHTHYYLCFPFNPRAIGRLPITICIRDPDADEDAPCIDAVTKLLFVKPGCERFQITNNVYAVNASTYIRTIQDSRFLTQASCTASGKAPYKLYGIHTSCMYTT